MLHEKSTGTGTIPLHVRRAKDIKEMILSKEVIEYDQGNDVPMDELDDVKVMNGMNLSDDSGGVTRPLIKRQKSSMISESIDKLGVKQVEASEKIADAIKNMTQDLVLGMKGDDFGQDEKISKIEGDMTEMKRKMDLILNLLQQK